MEATVTETYTSLVPISETGWDTDNNESSSSYYYGGPDPDANARRIAGIVMGSLYLLITVAGLAGNGTVIFVVLRYAKMKTVTNCYILNLAVADALFVTFLTFLAVSSFLDQRWVFGAFLCKVVFGVDGMNMFISLFCLTAMSVDRYVAVCHAMKSRSFRNLRVATAVNSSIWVLSILASIPITHFTQYHEANEDHPSYCFLTFERSQAVAMSRYLLIYFFVVGFVVPLVVIVACYASIMTRLRDMNKKTGKPEKSRKVNRMVLIVIITFVVCWWPFYVCRFMTTYWEDFRTWSGTLIVTEMCMGLSYVNSCVNPLLYAFLSDNFRKSFQKAWCCHRDGKGDVSLVSHASRWKFGKSGGRGKPKKKGGRFRLHDDEGDDENVSGTNNQYPLTATAVTSAISESNYPRNGELVQVQMERPAIAIA
ncbi:somatostatin receptor type 5-like [Patiria miniata]|uniref:G-protein coupled receptors family 1 profile domain-containing protein n=1 Tax=Patiria miniata TaxID=46514 RepID=A0A914AJB0_PATMI|nr:somatostatin receptor type 5-like [Patiria miniata]